MMLLSNFRKFSLLRCTNKTNIINKINTSRTYSMSTTTNKVLQSALYISDNADHVKVGDPDCIENVANKVNNHLIPEIKE